MPTLTPTRARKIIPKPELPWPGFPLYWHPRGYWMCRRNGEAWNYEADANESYRRFVIDEENLRKGVAAEQPAKRFTLSDAVNLYLTRQKRRMDDGEIGKLQFAKCRGELMTWLPLAVKLSTPLTAFRSTSPDDYGPAKLFASIRSKAIARGLDAGHRHITIVRAALNYAAGKRLMALPDFGDDFDPPSQSRIERGRRDRDQKQGERAWTVAELRKMIAEAKRMASGRGAAKNLHIEAQILLALFAALGSDDLSAMTESELDRKHGIVKRFRAKNGKPSIAALPPEAWAAIDVSIAARAKPSTDDAAGLLFRTSTGRRCNAAPTSDDDKGILKRVGRNDTIGKNFQRFAKRIGLQKPRAGFKTLRAMCRTLMTGAGVDEDIRAAIMGRKLRYAADEYYLRGDLREKLFYARDVIHDQLFPKQIESPRKRPTVKSAGARLSKPAKSGRRASH
jgi:hypothetical protein